MEPAAKISVFFREAAISGGGGGGVADPLSYWGVQMLNMV